MCPRDGTPLEDAPGFRDGIPVDLAEDLEGKRLADRFDVGEIVATGGMGTVYRATQLGLGRAVALKVLRQHSAWDRDTVQRFHREAKTMSLLVHPNTVRVIDFGETPEGLLFLAMEYLEGRTLSQAIRDRELGVQDAVDITAQILSSLKEAHDKGVIHRDLKPDNIFLTEDPASDEPLVKVLDFGIAKIVGGDISVDALETQAGTVFGTPKYMSPEQAQGHELDGRSDLYAVGALLYAMLTGSPPFDDPDAVVVMAQHIRKMPVSPRQRVPSAPIPPALDRVVMKALAKSPEDRFRDAGAFLEALNAASPAVRAFASASRVTRAIDRAWRQPKVRRAGVGALAGSLAVVALAALVLTLTFREDARVTAAAVAAEAPNVADAALVGALADVEPALASRRYRAGERHARDVAAWRRGVGGRRADGHHAHRGSASGGRGVGGGAAPRRAHAAASPVRGHRGTTACDAHACASSSGGPRSGLAQRHAPGRLCLRALRLTHQRGMQRIS